jgi:hypothetical protein
MLHTKWRPARLSDRYRSKAMEEWVAAREAVSLDLASNNQVKLLTNGAI